MIVELSNRLKSISRLWPRGRQFLTPPVLLILTTIVGLACCQTLHLFGSGNPDLAISLELQHRNPVAWLMLVAVLLTVLIAMRFYVEARSFFQVGLNGVALINFLIVALTTHGTGLHNNCFLFGLCCLGFSTCLLSLRTGWLLRAGVISSLFAMVFMAALLFASEQIRCNIGFAEKLPYVFYALTTTWILCFDVGWSPRRINFDGVVEGKVLSRRLV